MAGATPVYSIDDERLAELDRLAVFDQDLRYRARRAAPEFGSWSSSLR